MRFLKVWSRYCLQGSAFWEDSVSFRVLFHCYLIRRAQDDSKNTDWVRRNIPLGCTVENTIWYVTVSTGIVFPRFLVPEGRPKERFLVPNQSEHALITIVWFRGNSDHIVSEIRRQTAIARSFGTWRRRLVYYFTTQVLKVSPNCHYDWQTTNELRRQPFDHTKLSTRCMMLCLLDSVSGMGWGLPRARIVQKMRHHISCVTL
jgi:hypothetical protein